MASTPKQVNGDIKNNNIPTGKRKKSRGNRGSYLSKWLDKTFQHIEESTPNMDSYDVYNPNMLWYPAQVSRGYDPFNAYDYASAHAEPMSLPTLPSYCNPMMPPFCNPDYRYPPNANKNIQVPRSRRRQSGHKAEELKINANSTPNCTMNSNYLQPKSFSDSQDYASLPPIVTSVADTNSNSDVNTDEKEEANNARRFSDPCVRGLPDVARAANGDVESPSEGSTDMSGSQVGSRLLTCLLDQIASLKAVNERLRKDLIDTKVELENVRQQNAMLHKSSSASIGAASSHTVLNSGLLGGQYSPGFVTDVVREIRDAARMREEALYSRVRALVLERSDNGLTSPETKFAEKTLEEIKSSLRASEADKRRMVDRIAKLEDELHSMRLEGNETRLSNGEDTDPERVRLRDELAEMRKAKQNAEEQAHKLERLVTQLRSAPGSKFNGHQTPTNGPESLPSDPEHEPNVRARRTSANSSNSTVVFGPVTDL